MCLSCGPAHSSLKCIWYFTSPVIISSASLCQHGLLLCNSFLLVETFFPGGRFMRFQKKKKRIIFTTLWKLKFPRLSGTLLKLTHFSEQFLICADSCKQCKELQGFNFPELQYRWVIRAPVYDFSTTLLEATLLTFFVHQVWCWWGCSLVCHHWPIWFKEILIPVASWERIRQHS